ncbi:MAG: hypothetical protein RR839_06505 [Oscillospiraceae bacterium]
MFTDRIRNAIMGLMFGRREFISPAKFYFGISTSDIAKDGSGIIEPSPATGYKRVEIINSAATFAVPAEGKVTNLVEIRMNELNTNCGTATHYFLSETIGGNAIMFQKLKPAECRPLPEFSTLYINAGDAVFTWVNQ